MLHSAVEQTDTRVQDMGLKPTDRQSHYLARVHIYKLCVYYKNYTKV